MTISLSVSERQKRAAEKAWITIRKKRIAKIKEKNESIEEYLFHKDMRTVLQGTYRINPPLIKPSKLTWIEKGGVGKELSDGWAINYAVGCTHACRFCYVDQIHKKYGEKRVGRGVNRSWGNYFYIPYNIDEAIEKTKWERWKGVEVMMSSTHDPYLPQLTKITRKILEEALPHGVRFCIQTRSPLVIKDLEFLSEFKDTVRVQISIATMNHDLSHLIEPRVADPESRLEIIKKAKELGLDTGVILAPIFPSVKVRPDYEKDLRDMAKLLSEIRPDHIYGECLHTRGSNIGELEQALGERVSVEGLDYVIERRFKAVMSEFHLKGRWWREHP
ncbi:MAG: radical SAM protein [Candidatus Thermoplasmatota archaeon]|nr:radical SAM protein [Candidatus Thermoplasmatota archaeon]